MKKTNGKKREGCHEGGRYKNILFILLEEPANNVLEVKHTLITHTHIFCIWNPLLSASEHVLIMFRTTCYW